MLVWKLLGVGGLLVLSRREKLLFPAFVLDGESGNVGINPHIGQIIYR